MQSNSIAIIRQLYIWAESISTIQLRPQSGQYKTTLWQYNMPHHMHMILSPLLGKEHRDLYEINNGNLTKCLCVKKMQVQKINGATKYYLIKSEKIEIHIKMKEMKFCCRLYTSGLGMINNISMAWGRAFVVLTQNLLVTNQKFQIFRTTHIKNKNNDNENNNKAFLIGCAQAG